MFEKADAVIDFDGSPQRNESRKPQQSVLKEQGEGRAQREVPEPMQTTV